MDYIDRIKKIKGEKKITNDRLAELTGIPLGTLSKILAGISDSPKLVNMVAIADALGCSLDYLIKGVPQNTNNYTLTDSEMRLVEEYRTLDSFGQDVTRTIISKEKERVLATSLVGTIAKSTERKFTVPSVSSTAKILAPVSERSLGAGTTSMGKRSLLLYDLPVSAGPGVYLDDTAAEPIYIPDNERTEQADYALRISGNSMEPKFHDGDVLLVQDCDSVDVGELGIFILDGNGYFKKYGGDTLISLNPEYGDILLKEYAEAVCCGRVVGKLKKK